MPLISYIIPAYNVPADMLCECVDSIIAVAPSECEIIVVDDGSDVPCADVLSAYTTAVQVLRQSNQGASVARNTGIEHARGEYIQFVDADDTLIAAPYIHCVKALQSERPDILTFHYTTDIAGRLNTRVKKYDSGAKYMMSNNLCVGPVTFIFRRDILNGLRFVPGLLHEDERFTPQLYLSAGRVVACDADAYYYRQRAGSLQHSVSPQHVERRLSDYADTMAFLQSMPLDNVDAQSAVRRRLCQMAMDYIYNTIVLSGSKARMQQSVEWLHSHGLHPLPVLPYTRKYQWFARMANSAVGRTLLLHVLPLLKREI